MDKLLDIFDRQHELMFRYAKIEKQIDPGYDLTAVHDDVQLHTFYAQRLCRQLAWFIVEEVGEVLASEPWNPMELHIEMADVLHFLVELAIVANVKPGDIMTLPPQVGGDRLDHLFQVVSGSRECLPADSTLEFIRAITGAIHELKWKPWKQNPKPTSINNFRVRVVQAIYVYVQMAIAHGMTSVSLHQFYCGKAQENHQRIESKL